MPPETDSPPPICRRILALAERDPRRAVPLARQACVVLQASHDIGHAWARYTLGWALLCWERFTQARVELQAARDHFVALDATLGVLRCRYGLLLAEVRQSA